MLLSFFAGRPNDLYWAWLTLSLSAMVALGYCVIAVNWYFQAKLRDQKPQAKRSLGRLRTLWLSCAICGYALCIRADVPWYLWRAYDLILLVLAMRAWWFVFRIRGPGLVNERLAAMEELESSALKYREIAELLPHIVWTASADGVVDFSNQCWRNYCRGDERTWIEAIHPDERDGVLTQWKTALIKREPMSVETRLLGGAGAYRTFTVKATPIIYSCGTTRWLGACADIEDQKLLAIQRENQAKQKAFFLNALSHDLRAPLHNVLLNAHLLKMSIPPEQGEEAESVAMIMENATAAGDLVSKLLDFARVGAQDYNTIEQVPLMSMLRQIARRFQPGAEGKGLYLMVGGDEEAIAQIDRHKLDRIISNLVDNAIKYTHRGGVSLEAVTTTTGQGQDVVGTVIRIADSGIGVPPEAAPFLFDEFYQVSNHERDRSKGFGMGLAICKSLAEQLGAEVRLARTGGEGSTFEIVLKPAGGGAGADVVGASAAAGVGAKSINGPDRGGRPASAASDQRYLAPSGLCSV
jgi:signal transduction histidine kinase